MDLLNAEVFFRLNDNHEYTIYVKDDKGKEECLLTCPNNWGVRQACDAAYMGDVALALIKVMLRDNNLPDKEQK